MSAQAISFHFPFSSGPLCVINLIRINTQKNMFPKICQHCNSKSASYKIFHARSIFMKSICADCLESHCETMSKTNRVRLDTILFSEYTITAGAQLDHMYGQVYCSYGCGWKGPRVECLSHHIICSCKGRHPLLGSDRDQKVLTTPILVRE